MIPQWETNLPEPKTCGWQIEIFQLKSNIVVLSDICFSQQIKRMEQSNLCWNKQIGSVVIENCADPSEVCSHSSQLILIQQIPFFSAFNCMLKWTGIAVEDAPKISNAECLVYRVSASLGIQFDADYSWRIRNIWIMLGIITQDTLTYERVVSH